MGKERSISIKIKENIYGQLEAIAQKQGSKLEDEIMEAIRSYIERMSGYRNDPFFQIGKAGKSGLKDLAKAHDKYLYE
jgi:metal-responsive CopG/Arc/MetJ family transcriptional regulator